MKTKLLPVLLFFLLIFYVFSAVDFAIAGSLILAAILFRISAVWLFSTAFLSFVLFFICLVFNVHHDFIADLSVSSYVLFASGLALFFIRGEKQTFPMAVLRGDNLRFIGVLSMALLIYPLAGATVAVFLGYGGLWLIFPRFRNSHWSFMATIFFLLSCAVFLITRQDSIAVQSAILAYSFLIIGVFQILADSIRQKAPKELVRPL